jgi:integrative and conjugative element protein (TIGR02256 family)
VPTVTITDTALRAITSCARSAADGRESGGVLLGHHHTQPDQLLDVVHAGNAGPRAVRRADFFRRDVAHAQALADLAYVTDGSVWLGEWHTHATGSAPSVQDLVSYHLLLADPELDFHLFLAVIVLPGPDHGWDRPRLSGWLVAPGQARQVPLLRRTLEEVSAP